MATAQELFDEYVKTLDTYLPEFTPHFMHYAPNAV
jgi:hypothetical protein